MAEAEFVTPIHATDEKCKPGFLTVTLQIKGLKIGNSKQDSNTEIKAQNAHVTADFQKRSMKITVIGQKNITKNYQLDIKKLPGDIVEGSSFIKVKKDRCLVYLLKAQDRSWESILQNGLETYDEEADEDNAG